MARHLFATDLLMLSGLNRRLYELLRHEELWRAKLFDDWRLGCDQHKGAPARDVYLDLASQVSCSCGCQPLRAGLSLLEVHRARARKWLDESNKPARIEALRVAVEKLGTEPHENSQLVPAFHADKAGDVTAMEVAAIITGVSRLFGIGGHAAFSQLHERLRSELPLSSGNGG